MAEFCSQEWLDGLPAIVNELPERPGLTAVIQVIVEGAPDGKIQMLFDYEDGRLRDATLGRDKGADIEVIVSYERALALVRGEADLRVLFMQGNIKVSGVCFNCHSARRRLSSFSKARRFATPVSASINTSFL